MITWKTTIICQKRDGYFDTPCGETSRDCSLQLTQEYIKTEDGNQIISSIEVLKLPDGWYRNEYGDCYCPKHNSIKGKSNA